MKSFVAVVLLVALAACANTDSDKLREENAQLKTQLETVTAERDALKKQIEAIRKALDMPLPASSAPAAGDVPATSESPVTPPATTDPATPQPPADASTSETPGSPEPSPAEPSPIEPSPIEPSPPATPASTPEPAPTPPSPSSEAPPVTPGVSVSPLYQYASDVLKAAQNYQTETRSKPPLECSLGFEAGTYKVERSQAVKRCQVIADGDSLQVRAEGLDGTVTTAP
jgi:hypothetical protein